jgi:hypothetical protein
VEEVDVGEVWEEKGGEEVGWCVCERKRRSECWGRMRRRKEEEMKDGVCVCERKRRSKCWGRMGGGERRGRRRIVCV